MGSSKQGKDAIYRPPMIAPMAMDEERILKNRKSESRAQKDALRKASRSTLIKDLANDLEGRPEEVSCLLPSNIPMHYLVQTFHRLVFWL